jgi:uncharacterized protein (TIGR01244 family)
MKTAFSFAAVLVATLACTTPWAAPPQIPASDASATTLQAVVPNFRQPREHLITGGQPEASAWSTLAAHGVTTVINLRPQAEMGERDEAGEVTRAGMVYREIPVADAAGITEAKARELWTLLEQSKGDVLVHCSSGNRVGALLAVGAATAGGETPEAALELGKRAGLTRAEPRVRELLELPPPPAD